MLPVVQMQHPRAVPPPTSSLGHFAASPEHEAFLVDNHTQGPSLTYQRSFPIRTLQSRRRAPVFGSTLTAPTPENHLRRKTPKGTIDAGYDGSPTQTSQGPPPLKHIVLPGPSMDIHSYPPLDAVSHRMPHTREGHSSSLGNIGLHHHFEQLPLDSSSWSFPADVASSLGTCQVSAQSPLHYGRQLQHYTQPGVMGSFPNIYQPVVRANEYNVRAFCPPPVAVNDSFSPGPMLQNLSTWNYRNFAQPGEVPTGHLGQGPSPVPCNSRSGFANYSPYEHAVESNISFQTAQTSHIHLENLSIDSRGSPKPRFHPQLSGYVSQSRFREKALAQAYKSYMDLLAYLQTSKKMGLTKDSSGSRSSPRLLVYPKPPKPSIPASLLAERDATLNRGGVIFSDISRHRGTPLYGVNLDYPNHQGHGESQNFIGPLDNVMEISQGQYHCRLNQEVPPYAEPFGGAPYQGNDSQVTNAKSSLAILNTLCEQSGWKWIEGLLLGGCLHYGLERFEEALDWFSKITSIDPR